MQKTNVIKSKILTKLWIKDSYLDAWYQEYHSLLSDKYILYQSLLIKREISPCLVRTLTYLDQVYFGCCTDTDEDGQTVPE